MGSGIPQYRWRERHQSRRFSVQSYWRASPAQSGYHLTRPISSSIFGLTSVTLRNHCVVARNRIGVLHRQQWPYRCVIFSSAKRRPAARRSSVIIVFASRFVFPAYAPASSLKTPRSSTGLNGGSPSFCPSSKSSGPWPGAVWTHPVLSAVTVSDGTTLWSHRPSISRWCGTFASSGCVYAHPSIRLPMSSSVIWYGSMPAVSITAFRFCSTSQYCSDFPPTVTRTLAYLNFGFTATHRLAGRVHGVVVHTSTYSFGLPTSGNFT